jgi:hypothetical protein
MTTPEMSARARLRERLTWLQDEETRLAALEDGHHRAQEQTREAAHRLHEAEIALGALQRDDPMRRTYAFVNSGVIEDDTATLAAQAAADRARADHDRVSDIDRNLSAEIEQSQARLRRAHNDVRAALAAVINDSDALKALLDAQDHAFSVIRGVRKACAIIHESRLLG